jgi:S-adenosylmethionine:tRNA ribosyltransferase-isomerase
MITAPDSDPRHLRIADFTYDLPDDRIAAHPLAVRDAARLLVSKGAQPLADHQFQELPDLLPPGALLVFNDTRVVRARLRFQKPTGTTIEVFCLEPYQQALEEALRRTGATGTEWICLVGNRKKWRDALPLTLALPNGTLTATPTGETPDGQPLVAFRWTPADQPFSEVLETAGQLPLPPYLHRDADADDLVRYQTVYARHEGAVAAPTAGLHFTPAVLAALEARGFAQLHVTLHVGAGTFRPVKADEMADHPMHGELISVTADAVRQLRAAVAAGRPVIPVGTTSARTLESLYWLGARLTRGQAWVPVVAQWDPYAPDAPDVSTVEALDALLYHLTQTNAVGLAATTQLLMAPGYHPRVMTGLITNFHQPQSTLLLLVAALIGPRWRAVYDHALAQGYRFLSYGDSSLLLP